MPSGHILSISRKKAEVSAQRLGTQFCLIFWWSQAGSNRRPPACKAGALPSELWPPRLSFSSITALHVSLRCSCTYVHSAARDPRALYSTKNPARGPLLFAPHPDAGGSGRIRTTDLTLIRG